MEIQHCLSKIDELFEKLARIEEKLDVVLANTTKKPRIKTDEEKEETAENKRLEKQFRQVLDNWNEYFGKNLKYVIAHRKPIIARLKEGYKIEDFMTVIYNKEKDEYFRNNPKYFLPQTLYGNKMDTYLNQNIDSNPIQSDFEDELFSSINEDGL